MKAFTLCLSFVVLSAPLATRAADQETHKIRVTLFGQPCTLQGPLGESSLKTIHAISPEQIPQFSLTEKLAPLERTLAKLRESKDLPEELDLYKEQLSRRLESEAALLSGLEEAQRLKKSDGLIERTKKFVPETKQKSFESLARKLETGLSFAQRKEVTEQVFVSFSEIMPGNPEEEFHKAIHHLKVQYVCTFEDSGEGDDSSN